MKDKIKFYLATWVGLAIRYLLKLLGYRATTLPGRVAFLIYPDILKEIDKKCKTKIIVTGTNGKTTTNYLINTFLKKQGTILYNEFGANMISGVVSAFLDNLKKTYDYCSLEVDEGYLAKLTKRFRPDIVVVTNIFRDQLDRYGEIDITRNLIFEGIGNSLALLNGDDPNLNIFQGEKKVFFSVETQTQFQNRNITLDAQFCPVCGTKLVFDYYTVGHLGKFHCPSCGFRNEESRFVIKNVKRNKENLTFDFADKKENTIKNFEIKEYGNYQLYNISAALSCVSLLGIEPLEFKEELKNFCGRLGRFEEIKLQNKTVIISLVKNPVSLSETFYSITHDDSTKIITFILNDNYADGRDISWIWDADFEAVQSIRNLEKFYCDGNRKEEIKLRLKYSSFDMSKCRMVNLKEDIQQILNEKVDKIYFLPTYSALFKTRNIVLNAIRRIS